MCCFTLDTWPLNLHDTSIQLLQSRSDQQHAEVFWCNFTVYLHVVTALRRRNHSVQVKTPRSVSTTSSRIDSNLLPPNVGTYIDIWLKTFSGFSYTCWNGGIGFGVWRPGNEAQQLSVFCRNCWLLLLNLAWHQTAADKSIHRTPLTVAEVDNLNIFSRWKQIMFIVLVSALSFTFLSSFVVFNELGSTDFQMLLC